jgi:alkylation response protein AidB-like acyl-CoA dehydrogenase
MDFTLSAEQLMIKDSVTRFAAEPPKGDPWTTFAELGWLALGAPEDLGGFGGPLETMILMYSRRSSTVTRVLPSPTKSRTHATIRHALRRLQCVRAMAMCWAAAKFACSARAVPRR